MVDPLKSIEPLIFLNDNKEGSDGYLKWECPALGLKS